jgi:hypothetical protein
MSFLLGHGMPMIRSLVVHVIFFGMIECLILLAPLFEPISNPVLMWSFQGSGRESAVMPPSKITSLESQTTPLERERKEQALKRIEVYQENQKLLDKKIESLTSDLNDWQQFNEAALEISAVSTEGAITDLSNESEVQILPDYLKTMRSLVAAKWLRLLDVSEIEWGVTRLFYQIDHDGNVFNPQIIDSKGGPAFRRICVDAVRAAGPFGTLPVQKGSENLKPSMDVTLTFFLREPEDTPT